jgi:hypothetical protein
MDNILDNYKSIMEFFGIKTDNMVLKLRSVYQERHITASSISIFVEGFNHPTNKLTRQVLCEF